MTYKKRYLSVAMAALLTASSILAAPVWHCSRNGNAVVASTPAQTDQFSIASFNSSSSVIGVSVRDLIDVYSGTPVRLGGLPLSACFSIGQETLSIETLTALGLQQNTIKALSRKSSIVQNNVYHVSDEAEMVACIEKNFPAVGYLSNPTETPQILPCF